MKFVDDDDDDGELNAIVRPSVCRLAVTLVHPTQAIDWLLLIFFLLLIGFTQYYFSY